MRRFSCDQCDKKFVEKSRLARHQETHVPREERKFACGQCPDRKFLSAAKLRVHMGNMHDDAPKVENL